MRHTLSLLMETVYGVHGNNQGALEFFVSILEAKPAGHINVDPHGQFTLWCVVCLLWMHASNHAIMLRVGVIL